MNPNEKRERQLNAPPPRKPLPNLPGPAAVPAAVPATSPRTWQRGEIAPNYQAPARPYGPRDFINDAGVRKAMLRHALVSPEGSAKFTISTKSGGKPALEAPPEFNELMFLGMLEQFHERPTLERGTLITAGCIFGKRGDGQKTQFGIDKIPEGMRQLLVEVNKQQTLDRNQALRACETRADKQALQSSDQIPATLYDPVKRVVLEDDRLKAFFAEFSEANRDGALLGKSISSDPPADVDQASYSAALENMNSFLSGGGRQQKDSGQEDSQVVFQQELFFDTEGLGIAPEGE